MGCLEKPTFIALAVIGCIGLLLMCILVPLSLSHVEYYEYGLKIRKTSGHVDTDKVYGNGRYQLGPTYDFIKYQADAQYVEFERLGVFSKSISNSSIGLSFQVDVFFTYFLIQEEVGELHQDLATSYRAVIESMAKGAIKNEAAASVSFTDFFQDRDRVESRFRTAVDHIWKENNAHCYLDQFLLGRIRIPESVAEKQLESRVQNERNDMESYLQEAQIEREQTAVEVNAIMLEKETVLRTALAKASLIRAKAEAQATQIEAEAQVNGTATLFEASEILTQEHKTAFTYIRTLANRENLDLDISYLEPENVMPTVAA